MEVNITLHRRYMMDRAIHSSYPKMVDEDGSWVWFYGLIAVTDRRNDDFMTSSLRYTLQMGTLGSIMGGM